MSEPQPLNTTELLLIRLEEAIEHLRDMNDGYNWDPATFAVTVIIGLLATMLAGLAIGQGFVAAGPGRLKSSHYAIGPWSTTQRTRFKWGEWRFRTTVQTPIIQLFVDEHTPPNILDCFSWSDYEVGLAEEEKPKDEMEDKGEDEDDNENESEDTESGLSQYDNGSSNKLPKSAAVILVDHLGALVRFLKAIPPYRPRWPFSRNASSKGLDEYFPATWLKLLTLLDLDKVELWQTECIGPDYIPTELPAAPAYGSIRDVIMLALLVGENKATLGIEATSKLPFVRSPFLTFTFRDHPLLGVVGFLDTFAINRDDRAWPHGKLKTIAESLNLMLGRVDLPGQGGRVLVAFLAAVSWRYVCCSLDSPRHLRHLILSPGADSAHALQRQCFPHDRNHPYENLGHNCLGRDGQNQVEVVAVEQDFDCERSIVPAKEWEIRYRKPNHWPTLFALAMARNPINPPGWFPTKNCPLHFLLQCFAVQSKLWVHGCDCEPDTSSPVCTACSEGIIDRAIGHRRQSAAKWRRMRSYTGYSFESVIALIKAPYSIGKNQSLASWAYLGFEPPIDSISESTIDTLRQGFKSRIQSIDREMLASQKSREAWFETACVLCDVAADIAVLRLERLDLFDSTYCRKEDEGLTPDEEKLPNREERWRQEKECFLEIRSPSRHIFPNVSMPLLEAVIGPWEVSEDLPGGIDLSDYPMGDLMICRVSLMAMLLGTAQDISLLEDDSYDRVVPIF